MEPRADSSTTTEPHQSRTKRRRVRLPVVRASAADHPTVFYFLQSVFQGPSAGEFQAALDDPFYEPHDRLLLRQRRRIVAHVHIVHRTMHLGAAAIPVAGLSWLGVAAEFRGQGLGAYSLRAAEVQMEMDGALLGTLRTSAPRFFRRAGWTPCAADSFRRVDACGLLARLLDLRLFPRRRRRFHIRPLLRWEYPALARIYAQNVLQSQLPPAADADSAEFEQGAEFRRWPIVGCAAQGPLERTEAYWKWLLDRRGYDQLYVALEGPELLDMDETQTRVVGYAATRGEQIVELMAAPDCPRAAVELLARCCGEAVEQGRRCVLLHAPPSSPLFTLFDLAGGAAPPDRVLKSVGVSPTGAAAGLSSSDSPGNTLLTAGQASSGTHFQNAPECPSERGETYMMRLLDPLGVLRRLGGEFERRAEGAGLSRPFDLGLLVEGRKFQLELAREGVRATSHRVGRSYLRLSGDDFIRLLLGQLDWDAATADGRLECSTALAAAAGRALFPALPFWRPPWDDLPAAE